MGAKGRPVLEEGAVRRGSLARSQKQLLKRLRKNTGGCETVGERLETDGNWGGTDHRCRMRGEGVTTKGALEGGEVHPPFQGAQPTPSHCLPGGKCQAQQHL